MTVGVKGATHAVVHLVLLRGTVVPPSGAAKLRFRSTHVTSVAIRGHSATLRGVGLRNGRHGVRFRDVLVAGRHATLHVWFGRYVRSSRLVAGTAVVR